MAQLAHSSVALDASNWLGPAGARYWRITAPGAYHLDVPEDTFVTSHEFAIRIETGNVALDGRGKAISGSAPPPVTTPGTPNLYGVRVNGGVEISGVQVANLRVSNKYFGVIFEAVRNGSIDGVVATGNVHGLYFWSTHSTTLRANAASVNQTSGIQCDGNLTTNTGNAIVDNVTDGNGHSGIWLWDSCLGTTVRGNRSRDNEQMGIALSAGANGNTIAFNVLEGNSTGLWIESNGNTIDSNLAELNTNVGFVVRQVSSNTIVANSLLRNQNAGLWLDQATGNTIRGNTVALNGNWGIFHANGSGGQSIFDNYFRNTSNAGFSASGANAWNVPLASGPNTVGGPYLGGNYWATPGGTGFSETSTDVDGNGIADSALALGGGNTDALPLHAKARVRPSTSFDTDNRADLAWRNPASGANAIWFMNGLTAAGQYIAPVEPGWSMVGRDSFDGDGHADILWRHADGRNAIWFMNGALVKATSGYLPPVTDANWTVSAVGDVDGDGFADVVWRHGTSGQHAVWFMRGTLVKWSTLLAPPDLAWRVAAAADFDGDGRAELLWRNASTGQNAIWWFESYGSFPGVLLAHAPTVWAVAGVGDFNGDGKADILWRDAAGQNAIWFQDGAVSLAGVFIPSAATAWTVGSIGDFNADGRADIAWRRSDGTTAVWLMNGAAVSASAIVGAAPGWSLLP